MFNQWVGFRSLSLKEGRQSTLSQILRVFNKDVLPILGGRSIYDMNRHDLLDLLSRIEQREALTTAEKCRTWFNQLFRYALVKIEGLEHNPVSDLDVVLSPNLRLRIIHFFVWTSSRLCLRLPAYSKSE